VSRTHKKISELLFWFQIFVTVAFFVPFQVHKMFYSTDGVILTPFLFVDIYAMFMLTLAIGSHRASPSRGTVQMVIVWLTGVTIYTVFTLVFLFKTTVLWNANDTVNSVFALIGLLGATALVMVRRLSLSHPDVRMNLAIAFRVVPQLMLALNVFASQSSKGLSSVFIICFHLLIVGRIVMAILTIKEFGQDRNRQCLLIAESLGWVSWWLVTAAWLTY
jgi:hypothetical protein